MDNKFVQCPPLHHNFNGVWFAANYRSGFLNQFIKSTAKSSELATTDWQKICYILLHTLKDVSLLCSFLQTDSFQSSLLLRWTQRYLYPSSSCNPPPSPWSWLYSGAGGSSHTTLQISLQGVCILPSIHCWYTPQLQSHMIIFADARTQNSAR